MGGKRQEAPDYRGAAQEQAAGDFRNLQYQTRANRPDIYTPWGASTWYPGQDGYYRNQITLDPQMEQALDAQLDIQNQRSQIAQGLLGNVSDLNTPSNFWESLPEWGGTPQVPTYTPANYSSPGASLDLTRLPGGGVAPQRYTDPSQYNINTSDLPSLDAEYDPRFEKAMYNRYRSLVGDGQRRDLEAQRTLLANQGLTPGNEAYDYGMNDLRNTQNEQNQRAAWDAVMYGANEFNNDFNRRLASRQGLFGERVTNANLGLGAEAQAFGQDMSAAGFNEAQRAARLNEQQAELASLYGAADFGNNLETQLFNQQMMIGGQGFNQNLASANYANMLRNANITEQLQREGWDLNKINAWLGGQQVQMPQFPGFMGAGYAPGPNYLGAAQAQGQWDAANNPWGPLGQIAGGLLGGPFGGALGGWLFPS